jgi:hypothetical protein
MSDHHRQSAVPAERCPHAKNPPRAGMLPIAKRSRIASKNTQHYRYWQNPPAVDQLRPRDQCPLASISVPPQYAPHILETLQHNEIHAASRTTRHALRTNSSSFEGKALKKTTTNNGTYEADKIAKHTPPPRPRYWQNRPLDAQLNQPEPLAPCLKIPLPCRKGNTSQ